MFQFSSISSNKLSCTFNLNPVSKISTDNCSISIPSIIINENTDANIKEILSNLSK